MGRSNVNKVFGTSTYFLILYTTSNFFKPGYAATDFYIWNGLGGGLLVGDYESGEPGTFVSWQKDEDWLFGDYSETISPFPVDPKFPDCGPAIPMLSEEFMFRSSSDPTSKGRTGYVVYVYPTGFYPANDPQGEDIPLLVWPSGQCF